MPLLFSIVIPVYNGAAHLERCLEAIGELSPAPLECIVVDDGSTDGSVQAAGAAGATVISLTGRRGPAAARNAGARAARGEILMFVDADVVVPRDTVARFAARFNADPDCAAVFGSYDTAPAGPGFISQYRNLLHCYTHQCGQERAFTFWTGCGAMRAHVFLAHGGFDESRTRPCIEDVELGMRVSAAGGRILLDKALQVQHLKRIGFGNLLWTDFADRAVPWTRLLLRSQHIPADLNLKWGQRVSVLAAGWFVLALAWAALRPTSPGAGTLALSALLAVALLAVVNRGFYRFLARIRGVPFALGAVPLHLVYFLCGGAGFVVGLVCKLWETRTGRRAAAKSSAASPRL